MHSIQKQRKAQHQKSITGQKSSGYSRRFQAILESSETLGIIEAMQPDYRDRRFPPTVTLGIFLQQALDADGSCQAAIDRVVAQQLLEGESTQSAGTGGYCKARKRLPLDMISALTCHLGKQLSEVAPRSWRWKDRRIKLIDGTTLSMPDTPENQEIYPQPSSQKEGVGFPLARAVGIISRETGGLLGFAVGPAQGKKRENTAYCVNYSIISSQVIW